MQHRFVHLSTSLPLAPISLAGQLPRARLLTTVHTYRLVLRRALAYAFDSHRHLQNTCKVDLTRGSQGTVGVIFVTFLMEVGGRGDSLNPQFGD